MLITSSSAVGDTNQTASSSNNLQPPQSPTAAAAIATLKQLIQSASTTVKPQQHQAPSQTTAAITLGSASFLPSPSAHPQIASSTTPGTYIVSPLFAYCVSRYLVVNLSGENSQLILLKHDLVLYF